MTRKLTECPTCHEHIPFVWHGHHAVASSPEDDDPWCKHCSRPLDDFRSDNPADYCAKAPDAVDAAIARVEANHADDDYNADRTPHPRGFARSEQTWLP